MRQKQLGYSDEQVKENWDKLEKQTEQFTVQTFVLSDRATGEILAEAGPDGGRSSKPAIYVLDYVPGEISKRQTIDYTIRSTTNPASVMIDTLRDLVASGQIPAVQPPILAVRPETRDPLQDVTSTAVDLIGEAASGIKDIKIPSIIDKSGQKIWDK